MEHFERSFAATDDASFTADDRMALRPALAAANTSCTLNAEPSNRIRSFSGASNHIRSFTEPSNRIRSFTMPSNRIRSWLIRSTQEAPLD